MRGEWRIPSKEHRHPKSTIPFALQTTDYLLAESVGSKLLV